MQPNSILAHSVDTSELDVLLDTFFHTKITASRAIHPHYETLWQELYRLISSGGKRLRPKLTIMSYQAYSGNNIDQILPAAFAQELLHLALLVHDDIIDRDYIRYGVDNISGAYKKKYETILNTGDRTHFADSAAILGGDLLISSAYEVINASDIEVEKKSLVIAQLATCMFEVGGGELLDTESAFRELGHDSSLVIAEYKTASYSFKGPLLTGAMLAGADSSQFSLLETLAKNIGIAYQLDDDLLGVFGDSSITGKTTAGDIREGKKTYLIQQYLATANADDLTRFEALFGNQSISDGEVESIRMMLAASGAKEDVERLQTTLTVEAAEVIDQLTIDDNYKQLFRDILGDVVNRSK